MAQSDNHRKFTVDYRINSRHTANAIMKQAGIKKKFEHADCIEYEAFCMAHSRRAQRLVRKRATSSACRWRPVSSSSSMYSR